jgi:hypothetical protein
MKFDALEAPVVEEVSMRQDDTEMKQLNDLQLALVGGGHGEVAF